MYNNLPLISSHKNVPSSIPMDDRFTALRIAKIVNMSINLMKSKNPVIFFCKDQNRFTAQDPSLFSPNLSSIPVGKIRIEIEQKDGVEHLNTCDNKKPEKEKDDFTSSAGGFIDPNVVNDSLKKVVGGNLNTGIKSNIRKNINNFSDKFYQTFQREGEFSLPFVKTISSTLIEHPPEQKAFPKLKNYQAKNENDWEINLWNERFCNDTIFESTLPTINISPSITVQNHFQKVKYYSERTKYVF